MLVEICANSLESALNAQKAGADRIELCVELGVGGITPSYGLLNKIKEQITIPVHVLIRPRSGDFTYSKTEFEVMLKDIAYCKEQGFEGIVSGVLKRDFTIDRERIKILKETAGDLVFTFHRAFDWLEKPIGSFDYLQKIGVNYILSSGQKGNVNDGLSLLKELNDHSKTCTIMPGGGVNKEVLLKLKNENFKAVHLSGTVLSRSLDRLPSVYMNSEKFLREDHVAISDIKIIDGILKIAKY